MLEFYPYRHIDKTQITKITDINFSTEYMQVAGKLTHFDVVGEKRGKRLVAYLQDDTGELELVWFQGIHWIEKTLNIGAQYLVFGRAGFFMNQPQITHPEMELLNNEKAEGKNFLEPIYPSTEKLKARNLSGRQIGKITYNLFMVLHEKDLPDNLPESLILQLKLIPRYQAFRQIHFPANNDEYIVAVRRLKFEELFLSQLRLSMLRFNRHNFSKGLLFTRVGELFTTFYNNYLPFELTGAQKRVLKDIRKDTGSRKQMNRLLQGDVGSGKTIVALLIMLIAADNGFQSCLMAPTEILTQQHFNTIKELIKDMPVNVKLLTGSTAGNARKKIVYECENGEVHILIGTHAIIEDTVKFKNLGLAIADEQHRFGVAQRAKLWKKNIIAPHILVMTATPIPRTLALTAYGDLDYSIMDEMPPGRQPVKTVHRYEYARPKVMDFIRSEIKKGRQAYIIYPLIEESLKVPARRFQSGGDFENLMKRYEEVKAFFPEPEFWISMVHGKQKPAVKETNMQRFVNADTQIMVSTTVIEVGVDVPNASVMVIESAERFGLPQLHQLRGRVGRGSEKSFCILLSGTKITNEARQRLKIMCDTNDGFKIAEKDLEIRGPGDIGGTMQSGVLEFKLANIVQDKQMLEVAKQTAEKILDIDAQLVSPENLPLKNFLQMQKGKTAWSKIS